MRRLDNLPWCQPVQVDYSDDQCFPRLGSRAEQWYANFFGFPQCLNCYRPLVWIVSNEQLLDWVQNPVPLSQLDQVTSLKCSTPQVDPSRNICNGIPVNENGLVERCDFPDFPFYTCYGCPTVEPTVDMPNPPQAVPSGQQARHRCMRHFSLG